MCCNYYEQANVPEMIMKRPLLRTCSLAESAIFPSSSLLLHYVGICFVCLGGFFSAIWSLHNLSAWVSHMEKTAPTHSMCHSWKLKSYFCLVQLRAGPNSWLIKGVIFALILIPGSSSAHSYIVKTFVQHSPILEKMHGVVNAEQLNLLTVQISVCLNFLFRFIIW